MSSDKVDAPQVAEGAPAKELPSRPAKPAKEKAPKPNKNAGLEVRVPAEMRLKFQNCAYNLVATRPARVHPTSPRHFRQDQGQARSGDCWYAAYYE